jgi:hypothetical protein
MMMMIFSMSVLMLPSMNERVVVVFAIVIP